MPLNIGILGGTFNPVHFGHLRLAIEAREQVGLHRVELVPASLPPHKQQAWMYPFAFRCRMLEEAVSDCPDLVVNELEGERSGPSYTVDTLQEYHRRCPGDRFYFIMGSEDFLKLEQWERWQELPGLTSFILVGRNGKEEGQLRDFLARRWPEAVQLRRNPGQWRLHSESTIHYLHIPRFDLSSSLIREKLATGLSLRFLVPAPVDALLQDYQRSEDGS